MFMRGESRSQLMALFPTVLSTIPMPRAERGGWGEGAAHFFGFGNGAGGGDGQAVGHSACKA